MRPAMRRLNHCYNVAERRSAARRRLPRGVIDYMDKGTQDQLSLQNKRHALASLKLLQRVLADVSDVQPACELLGGAASMPLAIAPTGIAGLCWYKGELELARAAARAGVPFTLATGSNTPMEEIAESAGGRLWFQLYMWRKRSLSYDLVRRAAAAGFEALIWTVDIPYRPNREHDRRNGFYSPYKLNLRSAADSLCHPRWLASVLARYLATTGMPRHANFPPEYQRRFTSNVTHANELRADQLSWEDVARLRDIWPGKLIIKGIMREEDACRAVACGVDGIVVSNHGGRNLDSAPATLEVLPGIAAAVGGKATVLVDSGIRRGSDIAKCLALGAKGVLAGRATLYGVAAGGQAGAGLALDILREELRRTMAYVGCQRVGDLGSDALWRPAQPRSAFTHS